MARDYTEWYDKTYPRLTKYGVWLRGNELNTLPKEEFEARHFRVLLARLSTYDDVAKSFTHQLLYQIASGIPDVFPDIAYLPPKNDVRLFEKGRIPWLLGTNTKFGPERFSLIAFSNSIVQEILNIPLFLETSNIPLKKSERLKRGDIPLVILGGSNSIYTTSLWGDDPLVDGVFIGGDARHIREIFETCADGYKNNMDKADLLQKLEGIPGFYALNVPKKNSKKAPAGPGSVEILGKALVPYNESEIGSGSLQISEGCRLSCGFCSENWLKKPYRELDASILLEKALAMKAEMGLEKIEFFSFNFNMYSQFYKLLWDCSRVFKNVTFKSQRFDMLARSGNMIEYQAASGKAVYSSGLEGISKRLRRYLNKNLDDDALYKSIGLIFKIQARELKIFILSTGLENESDFNEFDGTLGKIKNLKDTTGARTRVIFSIAPVVKFPWTPLEFDRAYPPEAHDRVVARISRIAARRQFEARLAMDTKEYMVSQILARASDPRIKDALLGALRYSKFIYYAGVSDKFYALFKKQLLNLGLKIEDLLGGFSIDESYEKPWAVIDTGVERKLLWSIFEKNIRFEEAGADAGRFKIDEPSFTIQGYRDELERLRLDEREKEFFVAVGLPARGLPRKYFGAVLARALMKQEPSLAPYYRSYTGSFWGKGASSPDWIIGDDIISLSWDKNALPILDRLLSDPASLGAVNCFLKNWGALKKAAGTGEPSSKIRLDSPYDFNGEAYFKKRGLKYTLYKKAAGHYILKFTGDSLKKKILSQCEFTKGLEDKTSGVIVDIVPDKKFNVEDFIQGAFVLPDKKDWVRIVAASSAL